MNYISLAFELMGISLIAVSIYNNDVGWQWGCFIIGFFGAGLYVIGRNTENWGEKVNDN